MSRHCPTCACADHKEQRLRAAMTSDHECCAGCGGVKAKSLTRCERCGFGKSTLAEEVMKLAARVAMILVVLTIGANAEAATLIWDRNTEADMKDYQVWACFTPNCVVIKT